MTEERTKMFSREEILAILDEVDKMPRRGRRTERSSSRSGSDNEYPEWDDKKVAYAKKVIKGLDDSIRGVCMLNKFASVNHKANIVYRIHMEELFITKPSFGRYEIPDDVWEYLVGRVERMMKRINEEVREVGEIIDDSN